MPAPATCDVRAMLDSASCFACISPGMFQILRVSIWASILSELSEESVTVNQLLDRGRCFACISPGEAQILRVQLLCEMNAALSGTPSPTPPTPPTPPVNDPVFDNLTHYWSADEAGGNARADSKGSIDLAEVGGVVSSGTGKEGNAADFTTNSYLKSSSDWRPTAPFSVSFWAKLRTLPAVSTTLFDLAMTDLGGTDLDLSVVVFADGHLEFLAVADSQTILTIFGALNTWHLIVFESDEINTSISVDGGAFVTVGELGNFSAFQTSISNLIDVGLTGNTTSPDGLVDEIGTYNVVLSQSDVTTLWNGGIGKFYRP